MKVDPADGRCRECGGPLEIIDADDCTLTVQCEECGDSYDLETDALNDGAIDYHPRFLARKLFGRRRTDDDQEE